MSTNADKSADTTDFGFQGESVVLEPEGCTPGTRFRWECRSFTAGPFTQEGASDWGIGGDNNGAPGGEDGATDAQSLYSKLEMVVLPMYYRDQDRYIEVMRHAIALNGSFFNTERMVDQYVRKAYFA